MQIPVMTFNIQHGLNYNNRSLHQGEEDPSWIDLSLMARTIQACGAEIIGLNEVRDASEDPCYLPQVQRIAETLGYCYYYFGKAINTDKGPYGNGLISKYPLHSVETIAIPDPPIQDEPTWYESRCLIKAQIDLPAGTPPLTVLITHMGLAAAEEKNAVQTIVSQIPKDSPVLLMGDFNLLPEDPILLPLRELLYDAASLLPPGENMSYPSDAPDQKIDYIMTSGPIKVLQAEIPPIIASDHRPHTALLELEA